MTTLTYNQALQEIWQRSAYDRGFISNPFAGDDVARLGLRRTDAVLDRLGRPQDRLRILHVAGSKGKGSTCVQAAGILTAAGLKTGLYTSPHLHQYRERFRIDGEPVSEATFAAGWERTRIATDAVEADRPELGAVTAFEMVTAMAFALFADLGCTAAVIEVGLGGTLDATNVIAPESTAIAALDYEHTKVLGATIAEIAANKAGIIKPGVPMATAAMTADALAVVATTAATNGAPWLHAGRDWSIEGRWRDFALSGPWGEFAHLRAALPGDHQADNAGLAIAGLWPMLGDRLSPELINRGLDGIQWPGRFDLVWGGEPTVLDGAHTPAAAAALVRAWTVECAGSPAAVAIGMLRDKDPLAFAAAFLSIATRFIALTPPGPRGMPAKELADAIAPLGLPVSIAASIEDALAERQIDPLLVTGSLTTVAAAREALGWAVPDPSFGE